jgi:aryl-alcohol dehydrogenase-like predicted oxidoreductase
LEETLSAFDDVIRQGKAHYIGASNWEAWRLARALWVSDKLGLASFSWAQNSYNLLEQELQYEMLPLCEDQGLGFTPYSSLAGGWLTGKYETGKDYPAGSRMTMRPEPYHHLIQEKTFRSLSAFRDAAKSRGIDTATLAFAWVLSHPQTTAVIIGPRKPEHFELAEKALQIPLSTIDRAELAALFK